MIKQVLLLVCLVAFPLFAQQDSVGFRLDAPDKVVAGNEFEVTLTFNKGGLKDYSRFSQQLPAGFTAKNIVSPNADFSFDEQRIRIIWLKLPAEQVIEVKYLISVNKRLRGELELDGTFAYVDEGRREYLELAEPINIKILPNPDISQGQVVSIEEFPNVYSRANTNGNEQQTTSESSFATIVRQEPLIETNGIAYVSLLVKTPEKANFLKLEESIPGGYAFEEIESGGATVSQAASLARFVWMKPPTEEMFTIRYRLVPILEKEQDPVTIEGTLSFNEEGKTKTVHTQQVNVNLGGLNESQMAELLKTGKVSGKLSEVTGNRSDKTGTGTGQEKITEKPGSDHHAAYERSTGSSMVNVGQLQARSGVYFRVQVAALKNPYFARTYFADYSLLKDVKVEQINGWSKYTVGPFSSYEEAENMKNRINRGTPVQSPFVVAYRDGKRVQIHDVL